MELDIDATKQLLARIQDLNYGLLCALDDVCREHGITYYLAYGTLIGAVRHQGFVPWDDDVDVVMKRSEYEKLQAIASQLGPRYILQDPFTVNDSFYDNVVTFSDACTRMRESDDASRYYHNLNSNHLSIDIFILDNIPDDQVGSMPFKLKVYYGMAMGYRYKINYADYPSLVGKLETFILSTAGKLSSLEKIHRKYVAYATRLNGESTKRCAASNYPPKSWNDPNYLNEWFEGDPVMLPIRDRMFPAPSNYDAVLRADFGEYMELPPEDARYPEHLIQTWEKFEVLDEPLQA